MLDLIDEGEELAAVIAAQPCAEDLGNLVGSQAPQTKFTASLEQLVDGKVAFEYIVEAVEAILDLTGRGSTVSATPAPASRFAIASKPAIERLVAWVIWPISELDRQIPKAPSVSGLPCRRCHDGFDPSFALRQRLQGSNPGRLLTDQQDFHTSHRSVS